MTTSSSRSVGRAQRTRTTGSSAASSQRARASATGSAAAAAARPPDDVAPTASPIPTISATPITVRMIAFAPGGSSSLTPESESTSASATRSARSGSFTVSWLPSSTPGIEPISSHPVAWRSTLPVTKWPKPATQSSSAAWKRSVPTIFAAVSGNAIIITRPKNVPEPTDVSPTTKPPKTPIRTAITWSWRGEDERRVVAVRADERLDEEADPADDERDAEDLLRGALVAVAVAFARATTRARPRASDAGAEPSSIHIARRAWTWPSWRCRAAPNDLKIAPWRMSVPIATVGLKPKTRISIGVISEPPPMPVIPTSRPISRPASDSFQSISA